MQQTSHLSKKNCTRVQQGRTTLFKTIAIEEREIELHFKYNRGMWGFLGNGQDEELDGKLLRRTWLRARAGGSNVIGYQEWGASQ